MPYLRCAFASVFVLVVHLGGAEARDKAIPDELTRMLKDEDPGVRIKAIMGLSKLGPEAVSVLIEALKDAEANVSNAAAYGLLLIKLEPADRLTALRPYLDDKSPTVRGGVAGALGRGGPMAIPPLVAFLKDEATDVRKTAVRSLQVIAQKEKGPQVTEGVIPELAKRLPNEEVASVRLAMVQALPFFGPKAIPVLMSAIDDRDAKVRANAAAALSKPAYKPQADTFAPALAKRLKNEEDVTVRQSLVTTLSRCGPLATAAIRGALADKAPEVQKVALTGLGQIGIEARSALPEVKELAAKAEHPEVRKTAVSVLTRFGPEGEAAVLELLKVDNSATRLACLQVLANKGSATKAEVPSLSACLQDKDESVRALAAFVLGKLGPDARSALPALEKLLDDKDERVRAVAEKAIKSIGGK